MFRLEVILLLAACLLESSRGSSPNRPTIGILTQETKGNLVKYGASYIASAYVEWLESAGANAVPILGDQPSSYYVDMFNSINGVLFPGGSASLTNSSYQRSASTMMQLALQANSLGDFFPVYGICLGFEQLMHLVSGPKILTACSAENIYLPLVFTEDAVGSRMFSDVPQQLMTALATENLTPNFHQFCMRRGTFNQNSKLTQFFRVLSTNNDLNGLEFISTVEGLSLPVYGLQWHPEKISTALSTSNEAKTYQATVNFFVSEARKNQHRFSSNEAEQSALINNYKLVATSSENSSYFFD